MQIFLKFLGWLILFSLLYFLSLDLTGNTPGTEATLFHKIFNMGVLGVVSIPLWWFTWKRFAAAFGPRDPQTSGNTTTFYLALRNPALMYYLMVLKLFLLAMGANGIITLSHHSGGARIFYIVNFIVLYLYALPFFFMKLGKLRKARGALITLDERQLSMSVQGTDAARIPFESAQTVLVDGSGPSVGVIGADAALYLGGPQSKISPFYVPGIERIVATLKEKAGSKVQVVESMKGAMQERSARPIL